MTNDIPNIVIGRLPIYLRELKRLAEEGEKYNTSSHELAKRLGISSAQIRKDLSHFGEFGKQGTGYHIAYLIEQLNEILHLDRVWDAALIGAGYMGHALAHYDGFNNRGFNISCVFDNDPAKIGEQLRHLTVQSMEELTQTIQDNHIQLAIIVVPAKAAQQITNTLVKSGITAILSYAPIHLNVPEHVHVSYNDPVIDLQQMAFYLT